MATLLAATRAAWEQAAAWGEPVYVVERPAAFPPLPIETRQARAIRRAYERLWGGRVGGDPDPPAERGAARGQDDADDIVIFDTMPASEVWRRRASGGSPRLLRVAYPDGRVVSVD